MLKGSILILLFVFAGVSTRTDASDLHQTLSTSIGMVNINITENASTLTSQDSDANTSTSGQSSTASVISLDMVYEFDNYTRKSYFMKATVPLLASDGSGFYAGAVGVNFYLNSLSSLFTFSDEGTSLVMNPTMRYYWGAAAGLGFVVYNTTTAKKSDLIFDLQLHGGGIFNFKKDWGIRGELGLSRGTGVATSTIGMKAFFGINYYLEK